ncbi:amylo-alpha-1,6-glucosidase [Alkalinema sp. FACHB-956]|uniref:amylo-alpha-1,6-glucosidase n=1 Tax=Alkalinema sp. FACHB-956 TaxID=2692768 RepID=UPI0016882A26|nr:amylo-alpha-1,6-glucosidase [Alkalinema sp. FACHB-956]MBD2327916.1 amylo-alpha-1,6-glucosidase [Alkalinema sp. FACHB-956]
MSDLVELNGKTFIPADRLPIPEWACAVTDRMQPTLTLKDDDLFLISDTLGNISGCNVDEAVTSLGLFCRDTRFLSRLELQIDGRSPILLSSNAQKGFALFVLCTNPRLESSVAFPDAPAAQAENQTIPAETLGIQREMVLNGGLFEEITLTNYSTQTIQFELSLSFDADFVDLFEVRGFDRQCRGQLLREVEIPVTQSPSKVLAAVSSSDHSVDSFREPAAESDPSAQSALQSALQSAPQSAPQSASYILSQGPSELTMAYQGLDGSVMEAQIEFLHRLPDSLKGYTALWTVRLASHETLKLGYRLKMLIDHQPASNVHTPMTLMQAKAAELLEEQEWRSAITQIRTDNKAINQIIERAEQDVYLLRQTFDARKVLSAGVPWFSTLFGRDSIIAASQTLILDPTIARDTLNILAHYQGKIDDDWRDEESGKILHELRFGEMARCQEIPHTPYYGTIDATPLWLMLYAEYYAWTHDCETLEQLWDNALAAMDWIDRNCRETGYLAYNRRSKRGLQNQGWKDSGDCIVDRQGQMAKGSIALCEVQAYVYAAKVRLSEIARIKKRIDLADRWQEEARDLQERFNRDFWMADLDYCALALDGEGNPVDSITSNPGHCLNLGILTPDKARSVAERLQAPDMFNGWGIRTLSSQSPAYNPMGYHVGSVWPHDNSLITLGLRSIGLIDQALEVAQGILDMTLHQPYQRPPELFCGYERIGDSAPVQYPVACSPQAWATGTVFQLLHMMINLVPDAPGNHVRIIDPALPSAIQSLSLKNLRVGSTLLDLEFVREGAAQADLPSNATACRVTRKRGNLRVVIEA